MEHLRRLEDVGKIQEVFNSQQFEIRAKVDHSFKYLTLFQWLACIVVGFWITPQAWIGQTSGAVENVFIAFIFGGSSHFLQFAFAWLFPAKKSPVL